MALVDATLLGLSKVGGGFELPEDAAVGIVMTMEPANGVADIRKDVNGNLVNLKDGLTEFRKYKFSLSCEFMDSPGFADDSTASEPLWPGDKVTLMCIPHLGAAEQQTFTAMVMQPGWQVTRDEWGAATSWSLEVEQV